MQFDILVFGCLILALRKPFVSFQGHFNLILRLNLTKPLQIVPRFFQDELPYVNLSRNTFMLNNMLNKKSFKDMKYPPWFDLGESSEEFGRK